MKKIKTGILISGRGSNMAALIKATREHDYPAEIVLVISNKADAPGLGIAEGSELEIGDGEALAAELTIGSAAGDQRRCGSAAARNKNVSAVQPDIPHICRRCCGGLVGPPDEIGECPGRGLLRPGRGAAPP